MLDLAQVFGDLFCIAILAVTILGMISRAESEERNAFFALIFTAMIYISLCLLEQFFGARLLVPTYASTVVMAIVIRVAQAELMHAQQRAEALYLARTDEPAP